MTVRRGAPIALQHPRGHGKLTLCMPEAFARRPQPTMRAGAPTPPTSAAAPARHAAGRRGAVSVPRRPRPPGDVGAAVAEALPYPLRGSRSRPRPARRSRTVQPPALPLPTATMRAGRLAAVLAELSGQGSHGAVTSSSPAPRAPDGAVRVALRPDRARVSRSTVVHDCEADNLRPIVAETTARASTPLSRHRPVVAVGAAETVLHGGATALTDATTPWTMRARTVSLLEARSAASASRPLEAELVRSVPLVGVSPVLDRPHATALPRLPVAPCPEAVGFSPRRLPPPGAPAAACSPGPRASWASPPRCKDRRRWRTRRRWCAHHGSAVVEQPRHDRRAAPGKGCTCPEPST